VIPVAEVRELVAALRRAGGNPRFTEYRGETHGLAWLVVREKELVPWLFAQRRGTTRKLSGPRAAKNAMVLLVAHSLERPEPAGENIRRPREDVSRALPLHEEERLDLDPAVAGELDRSVVAHLQLQNEGR